MHSADKPLSSSLFPSPPFTINSLSLEKTINLSSLNINININIARCGRQSRNSLDIRSKRIQITSTDSQPNITDRNRETSWRTLQLRVVRKRVLGLGNANRQVAKALGSIGINLLLRQLRELHLLGTVHLLADSLHALLNSALSGVKELEVLLLLASRDNSLSEINGTSTTLSPVVSGNSILSTSSLGLLADNLDLGLGVGLKLVDGDNDWDTVLLGVLNVLLEVDAALAENLGVLLGVDLVEWGTWGDWWTAAVNLQGTDSGDNDNTVWLEAGGSALDVEETLTAHGEIETSLGDNEAGLGVVVLIDLSTGKLESKLVSNDGGSTNGDVGEWTSVDKDWGTLKRLHHVWLDGILHEDSQGTTGTNVVASNWLTAAGSANDHAANTLTHIRKVVGKGKDSHDLGSDRDIETSLASLALLGGSGTDSDTSEMSIVDIKDTSPGDGSWVNVKTSKAGDLLWGKIIWVGLGDTELLEATVPDWLEDTLALLSWNKTLVEWTILLGVLVEHAGLDGSSQQVVGSSDGVDVTSQVKVELVHRNDLRVTTTGGATLDTKGWSLGWLADVGESNAAEMSTKCLSNTHGGGRLALTEWCWGNTGDNDIATVAAVLKTLEELEINLGLVGTIWLELSWENTDLSGDLGDLLWVLSSGDSNIRWNWALELQWEWLNVAGALQIESVGGRVNNVLQKHGNGHWANSSWNWSDEGSDLLGGVIVDITDQSLARLLGLIWDEVGANVNDNGSWLDPFTLDKVCLANGGNKDISVLDVLLDVLGAAVADSYSGIGVLKEVRNWRADNIRAAKDNSVLASNLNTGRLEQLHDTLWSAWSEEWLSTTLGKLTNVGGTEAINILLVGNGRGNVVLGDVLWNWELNQDTVDGWVVVEVVDALNELDLGDGLWVVNELAGDAGLLGGLELHLDIGGRVGAVANLDNL